MYHIFGEKETEGYFKTTDNVDLFEISFGFVWRRIFGSGYRRFQTERFVDIVETDAEGEFILAFGAGNAADHGFGDLFCFGIDEDRIAKIREVFIGNMKTFFGHDDKAVIFPSVFLDLFFVSDGNRIGKAEIFHGIHGHPQNAVIGQGTVFPADPLFR